MKKLKHKLIGDREIVFVKFPNDMLVKDIVEKLWWARTWEVKEFFEEVIIQCWIKPQYLKHFIKKNKKRMLWFERNKLGFSVKMGKNIYNCYTDNL